MSHLSHTQPRVLQFRLPRWLRLAAVALIAAGAIAIFVAVSANDEAIQTPNAAVSDSAAGIRYDGGPEEGTTGIVPAGPAEGIRYDGGPEEGTSGVRGSSPGSSTTPGIRYDGGPEEGSALAR